MKKWFLSILAVIILVGMSFSTSHAWNYIPSNEAHCTLSYSMEGNIITDLQVVQTADQNYSFLENHNIIFAKSLSGDALVLPALIVKEVPRVSYINISCSVCSENDELNVTMLKGIKFRSPMLC